MMHLHSGDILRLEIKPSVSVCGFAGVSVINLQLCRNVLLSVSEVNVSEAGKFINNERKATNNQIPAESSDPVSEPLGGV